MFNNIGHKIQKLAKAFWWIGIVFWTIKGIDLIGTLSMTHQLTGSYVTASSAAGVLVSIVTIIVGVLVSWIGSLVLYAFGQLWRTPTQFARTRKPRKNPRKANPHTKREPESSLFSRGNGFLFFALISASPCG